MGKNLVVRLHVYLMCFLLVFATPYAHALAGDSFKFDKLVNVVKAVGGITADYLFKDPSGKALVAKAQKVANSEMAQIARKRVLCGSPIGGIACSVLAGYGASRVAEKIRDKGYTIDITNQTIYIIDPDFEYVWSATVSVSPPVQPTKTAEESCRLTAQRMTMFATAIIVSISPTLISQYQALCKVVYRKGATSSTEENYSFSTNRIKLPIQGGKRHMTDQEIEDIIINLELAVQIGLATSPDFQAEGHAPTARAAQNAGADAPDDDCPAGQKADSTGKCVSPPTSACQLPQVYDAVQKKCVTPKSTDGWPEFCEWAAPVCEFIEWFKLKAEFESETEKTEWPEFCDWAKPVCDFIEEYKTKQDEPDDWPEFCDWAKPVCDFIDWVKKSPDDTEPLPVDVEDTAGDAQSITSQILTLGYVSGGVRACPSDLDLSFQFMGQSIGFELSYEPLCDMLLTARPVVIAIAYFQAAKIVFVGRRD